MTPNDLKNWLEPHFSRLEKMAEDIAEMKVTSAGQAKDIAYHIKRTDLLEERTEQLATELKPVAEHVQQLRGGWMLIVGVGTLVGIAAAVWGLLTQ
jgi:hypothetical protein